MSIRMFSRWFSIGIVGTLLFAATLKAEPPQAELAPAAPTKPGTTIRAEGNQVVVESGDSVVKASSILVQPVLPLPVDLAAKQVRIDVKVVDVDHATLRALTKSDLGPHEFYKTNGLIPPPKGVTAAIGDLFSSPGQKVAAPPPLPVRTFAVRKNSVEKQLFGHDISPAFKTIAEPSLVTTSGREAALLSGGEVPILVPQTGQPEVIGFQEFGLRMKILPRLLDNDRVVLALDVEDSERHNLTSDRSGSSNPLIATQGFRLSMDIKLGENLLVAQQIGNSNVTRLVQIQPTLVAEQAVAEKPAPVLAATEYKPVVHPTPARPLPTAQQQIQIEAVIYEVDPAALMRLADKTTRPVADLLKANGFKFSKKTDTEQIAFVSAIQDEPFSLNQPKDIGLAFNVLSRPTIKTLAGQEANVQLGSVIPIPVGDEAGRVGRILGSRNVSTTLKILPLIDDDGSILLDVRAEVSKADQANSVEVRGARIPGVTSRAIQLTAKLQSGQYLLIANGSSEADLTQFVQLTPKIVTPAKLASVSPPSSQKPIPPVPAALPNPAELEITVEDRWPIGDIKVGQRVIAIPLTIEKTSLQADLTALTFDQEFKISQRVTRIEPLPKQAGRRVTVSIPFPFVQEGEKNAQMKAVIENYFEGARTSTSTFVIPASTVSQADLLNGRPVQEIYDHIPAELRPRPVEVVIGESFSVVGVAGLLAESQTVTHHESGPLSLHLIDDDPGRIWLATATKIGLTRLIQLPFASSQTGPARLTEYLVKADTRELELHIRQQFPSAKVTITSVGASSLLLTGTVASVEDSRGIVDLAQEFAPKVLNRLKVPGPGAEPRAMRLENEIEVTQVPLGTNKPELVPMQSREPTDPNPKQDRTGKTFQPSPVKPASATSSKKNDELRELLHEIRELRQEVRTLNERLERERPTTNESSRTEPHGPDGNALSSRVYEFQNSLTSTVPLYNPGAANSEIRTPNPAPLVSIPYSVADLVVPIRPVHIRVNGNEVQTAPTAESDRLTTNTFAQLRELITSTVAPDSWGESDGQMTFHESTLSLVVRQTEAAHRDLRDLFEFLRSAQDWQLSLDLRVIKTDENFHGFGFDLPMAWSQLKPNEAHPLGPKQADALILAAQKESRVSIWSLPKITLTSGQSFILEENSSVLPSPLHLSGFALSLTSNEHRFVRLHLSTRSVEHDDAFHNLSVLRDGHTLFINITDAVKASKQVGVPILNIVPGQDRLFTNVSATKSLKPGEKVFLLATASVIGVEELEQSTRGRVYEFQNSLTSTVPLPKPGAANSEIRTPDPDAEKRTNVTLGVTAEDALVIERLYGGTVKVDGSRGKTLEAVMAELAAAAKVNIVLDPRGLAAANVTAKTPVQIKLSGVKLNSALKMVLEPLQLGYVIESGVIRVTSRERAAGTPRVVAYPVADLIRDNGLVKTQLDELSHTIQTTVAPNSWEELGGSGSIGCHVLTTTLLVRQPEKVHDVIREFLDLLRKAQHPTKPPVAASLPKNHTPAELDIAQKLLRKTSVHFDNTPLKKVLEQLVRQGDINILLDNAGLEDNNLKPTTPVTLSVDDISLASVLRLILEPLNLEYTIKHEIVNITSRERSDGNRTSREYSVEDLIPSGDKASAELEHLVGLIQKLIAPNSWSAVGGIGNIKADSAKKSLLIRQTEGNHSRLQELLETLRKLHRARE